MVLGVIGFSGSAGASGTTIVSGGAGPTTTTTTTTTTGTDDATPGQRLPTRGPVDDTATTRAVEHVDLLGGLLFGVPIVDGDFADPFALSERDAMYFYATNTVDAHIPVMRLDKGQDVDAKYLGDALPTLPSWTLAGFQWAPSVWARPDGTFVMYYATPHASTGFGNVMCISRATSDDPAGPFTDDSSSAFICPLDQGGAIDPSIFIETDGTPYLVWKNDGDCCKLPTNIYSQELTPDGLDVAAAPVELLTATEPWEGDLIEAPAMVRDGSAHYLFYSANDWDTTRYAIGVATCTSIAGPCTKPDPGPWMASTTFARGPGGQEFFQSPEVGGIWMVHHGWLPHEAGTKDGQRRLYLDRVSFHGADRLPTRSDDEAVAESLLDDAGFLALLVGLGVGIAAITAGTILHRRGRRTDPADPTA